MSKRSKGPTVDAILKLYEHDCKPKDKPYIDAVTWAYNYFDTVVKKAIVWRDFCKPETFLEARKKSEVRRKKVIVIKKGSLPKE